MEPYLQILPLVSFFSLFKTFRVILKTATSACDAQPCLNGATCMSLSETDYICQCPLGFAGNDCEIGEFTCKFEVKDLFTIKKGTHDQSILFLLIFYFEVLATPKVF